MKRFTSLAVAAVLGFGVSACSGGGGASVPATNGVAQTQTHVRHLKTDRHTNDVLGGAGMLLGMLLFDAPLPGANGNVQFNAGIIGVDVIDSKGDSWQLIANSTPQVVNLLALQTAPLALGTGSLPAGTYPTVELLLDPATTNATINGQTYPVRIVTPNHPWWDTTQTVQAVDAPLTITGTSGANITASLDFNIFRSAKFSNGVVFLTPKVAAGFGQPQVHGTIANSAGAPVQNATVIATDANGNVANVTVSGADGTFNLHGISPGSYTLTVANTYTTDAGATVTATGNDTGAAPSTNVVVGPNDNINVGALTD